jgi:CRISPR type IV-associated protein Csf1
MTASTLYAGSNHRPGPNRCYYCGSNCDDTHLSADLVKDTFTNRDIVAFPNSAFVCEGCASSLGAGPDEMEMLDGETRNRTNARGMQPRMYSWILSTGRRVAATKAHIALLRAVILNPPDPPFAIILADSGQKQLIFRAPIALSREVYPILLEDARIEVDVSALAIILPIAARICAGLGKPALLGDLGYGSYFRYEEYFGDTDGIERWLEIRDRPLSRLAAWLSPSKEDAQHEHPGIERPSVPAKTGRTHRPGPGIAGGGPGSGQAGCGQVLLDLG